MGLTTQPLRPRPFLRLATAMQPLDDLAFGCLIGGWCGDAAGAHVEFGHGPISHKRAVHAMHMPGGGPHGIGKGQVTDDSELELAQLQALMTAPHPKTASDFPVNAVAQKYIEWFHSNPFDMGRTCRNAFGFARNAVEMCENARVYNMVSQANGALMRSAGLAVWGRFLSYEDLAECARMDARLSHPHPITVDVNAVYVCTLAHLLRGCDKGLAAAAAEALECARQTATHPLVLQWLHESQNMGDAYEAALENVGHVKHAFMLAMYHLGRGTQYEDAIRHVIQQGGDTDTNAKVVGSLLGAAQGVDAIPKYMRDPVLNFDSTQGVLRPATYCPRWTWLELPGWIRLAHTLQKQEDEPQGPQIKCQQSHGMRTCRPYAFCPQ